MVLPDPLAAEVFRSYRHDHTADEVVKHTPAETLENCCQILYQHKDVRRKARLQAHKALCDALCPGPMTDRQTQWATWISGTRPLPHDEFAKFTPPSKIRAWYPDYYKDAANVYKWAETVGLGSTDTKELWRAVQTIKIGKKSAYTVTFFSLKGGLRTAHARVADGQVLLELIPNPSMSEDEAEGEYDLEAEGEYDLEDESGIICVVHDGHIIAMFDRNGMKWDNALSALIRDRHITLTAEQRQLNDKGIRLRGHPDGFDLMMASSSELKAWTDSGRPILKAARAKAGHGKTTSIKADKIRSLARALGHGAIGIPESSVEASRLWESLSAEYKTRKANGTRPPTENQLAFAQKLASQCKVDVPEEATATFGGCSEFIERLQELAPPSDRQLQYARSLAGDTPLPDPVLKSSRACRAWIDDKIGNSSVVPSASGSTSAS